MLIYITRHLLDNAVLQWKFFIRFPYLIIFFYYYLITFIVGLFTLFYLEEIQRKWNPTTRGS